MEEVLNKSEQIERLTSREEKAMASISMKEYKAIHHWVRKNKPRSDICEHCLEPKDFKKLEIANISHTYKREFIDYLWLCRSCHVKYDNLKKNLGRYVNMPLRGKEHLNWVGKQEYICFMCDKSFLRHASHIRSKVSCCSRACANRYKYSQLKRNNEGRFIQI